MKVFDVDAYHHYDCAKDATINKFKVDRSQREEDVSATAHHVGDPQDYIVYACQRC